MLNQENVITLKKEEERIPNFQNPLFMMIYSWETTNAEFLIITMHFKVNFEPMQVD